MSALDQTPGWSKAALLQLVAIEVALIMALIPMAGWRYALAAGLAVAAITNWWPGIRPFAAVAVIVLVMTSPSVLSAAIAVAALIVYATAALAEERSQPLWSRQTAIGVGAAMAALLLVLLFSWLRYDPTSNSGGQASGFEPTQPAEAESGDQDLLDRLVDAVRRFFSSSDDGQEATVGGAQPPEQSSDINWWRILLVAAIALALAVLAWLLWRWLRRRRQTAGDAGPGWAVRRLDRVGARAVRPRRASETPSAYGDDIDHRAQDGRLGDAGRLVSDLLYRPPQAGPGPGHAEVRSALDDLEQRPPGKVRDEPRGGRLGRWRRGPKPNGEGEE